MALRPSLVIPDTKLRQKAEPIAAVDDEVRALADDMLETMYKAPRQVTQTLQSPPAVVTLRYRRMRR